MYYLNEMYVFLTSDEVHGILECFLNMLKSGVSGASLAHRVAALLRRYRAARPQRAAVLLHTHRDTIACVPDCIVPA